MSFRLRRKTRPQGDVEIYGGPLKQKRFDGGMNIDVPASEIKENEVSYASNVIFREFGFEPRPGSVEISEFGFEDISNASCFGYEGIGIKFGSASPDLRHIVSYNSTIRYYGTNPGVIGYTNPFGYDWNLNVSFSAWNPGTGDSTIVPYRRGFLIFNAAKITYSEYSGAFQVNAANPVHGIKDDNASGGFKYRYLITLSRSSIYGADGLITTYTAANRYATGAELVHESGSNGPRYQNSGTSTARSTDYGEVFKAAAISSSSAYTLTAADMKAAFSSASNVTDNSAAGHFTHATVWRTCDFGDAGLAVGNNRALFYWVADVKRSTIFDGGGYAGFSDTYSDNAIQNNGLLLKTQGFSPIPSGSCGAVAGGWMFVSDRTNATPENYLYYSAISTATENIGYHFYDIQKWKFNQGVRALRASQDILSIFCESSSHICNMTSYVTDASKLQSIPFLNYFYCVDPAIGIKDWATLDGIDQNTFIAVCSDNSIRKWDGTKWGDDIAYNKVSTEIQQIVPASPFTYERGSVGRYYNGAYYLWYSKDTTDTKTTSCLRYGFGGKAGFGWSYYTNTPQPGFKRGVSVVHDAQGVQRLIVIRASNGKFYWVDSFKPFVGAVDNTNIGVTGAYQMVRQELDFNNYPNGTGTEISSTVYFRELISTSETEDLIHEETFHKFRPMSESVGYRSEMSVSTIAFIGGGTTAYETVSGKPIYSSIKFLKEISNSRVKIGVSLDKSGWRYIGVESYFRYLERTNFLTAGDTPLSAAPLSYTRAQAELYQADLAQDMEHWISRRDYYADNADGVSLTTVGTTALVQGADSKVDSGIHFQTNSSIHRTSSFLFNQEIEGGIDGSTIMFWVRVPTYNENFIYFDGSTRLSVKFTDSTHIQINNEPAYDIETALGTGWNLFTIVRDSTETANGIRIYYNKELVVSSNNNEVPFGGSSLWIGNHTGEGGTFAGSIFDFRVYSKTLSEEAIAYYYDVIINNQSDLVLPQI